MLEKAIEKLEQQFTAEKDPVRKQFAKPILEHMKKRCREDEGLCKDVLQEHKTWANLYAYITSTARKHIKGNAGAVLDQTVYEWAEDYYRKDDKAEAKQKAKAKADQKKKTVKAKAEDSQKAQKAAEPIPVEKAKPNTSEMAEKETAESEGREDHPAKEKEPKKETAKKRPAKKKEAEGQMNIFDFMGV